ncbi:hypothetical protein NDU88_007532 [Pleurodeles waltl]|uniref:Gypsy retrotransposon integrase-like protein 1 n=1 Tax=Pleurodeles waltl TaxID=8319 RepID=A0AAV7NTC4_PLEWA|nr:hypothetical protein NDU88_007532 [Pleurodeles waltl]
MGADRRMKGRATEDDGRFRDREKGAGGCSQSVIRQDLVEPRQGVPQANVLIACVHGDQAYYPVAIIKFQWRGEDEPLKVGVLPHLEEDIIIGTDYTAFPRLLIKAGEEHMMKKRWEEVPYDTEVAENQPPKLHLSKRQKRIQRRQYWGKDYESNKTTPGAMDKVYTVAGDFRQRDDPSLKNAWEKALSNEEPGVGPTFQIHNHLLHRLPQSSNDRQRQLLVPGSYRQQVLQLAHGDQGEGHLGREKNEEAILRRFYWPGVYGDIHRYCLNCQKCQL